MDEKYLREYADRGALLDLKKADDLKTDKFEPDTLGAGEFDGGLYGLNAGINSFADPREPGGLQGGRRRDPGRQDLDLGRVHARPPREITTKLERQGLGHRRDRRPTRPA